MTARFNGRGPAAGLIGILDRISRPRSRNDEQPDHRRKRLAALEFVANELSLALFYAVAGGLVLIMALVLLPSSFWDGLDDALRTAYWRPFHSRIGSFQTVLQGGDKTKIEAEARLFFDLARDLRPRDHGEADYVRMLELAVSAGPPAVRLRAAELGVSLRPNDSFFWYRLGMERMQARPVVQGIEALQKAFRLRPYSRQIAAALISAFEQTGDEDAVRRVRTEYVSGIEAAAGKRAPIQLRYMQPDGVARIDLLRLDACSPVRLHLRDVNGAVLKDILFPPVDGLQVSVKQEKSFIFNKLSNFRAGPAGGFVSTIEPGDKFMATPALSVGGNPEGFMQMEFCLRSRSPV